MTKPIARAAAFCLSLLTVALAVAQKPARIPRLGYKAPDFTLDTLDEKPLTLSELTADSSVVLVVLRGYPGYQCPICTMQVADLRKHAGEFSELNAKVVLVYPGPAEDLDERAVEFLRGRDLSESFFLVTDPDYKFTEAYGLRWDAPRETAYPSAFVIDRQGTIRYAKTSKTHGGRAKTADLLKALPGAE